MKKSLISISVSAKKAKADSIKTDLLAIGVFKGALKNNELAAGIDSKLDGAINEVYKLKDFEGKELTTAMVYTNNKIGAKRVLLVGLGEKKKFSAQVLRKAASLAAKIAAEKKCSKAAFALHTEICTKEFNLTKKGQVIAEAVYFGGYKYDEFVSGNSKKTKLDVSVIDDLQSNITKLKNGIETGNIIGEAQNLGRTLANRPPNVVYPAQLVTEAKKLAKETTGLTCTVFDDKQLKQKKMGGIMAVGQGSEHKPRMIILKYLPKNAVNKKHSPVALVGKAITFDSGGISLKPGANMDQMKMDMTGGASVIAAMKAVAELKLPVKVYGIICAAENTPSHTSYRPGDIITTFSGKTVEILNTDAEGRMVLADGIHYAKTIGCKTVVDICTLTGACMVALGSHKAGLMGNNQRLIEQLKRASEACGEPVWQLPCGDEYTEEMKSKIADLKNLGNRWGGASSAASFLGEFAGDTDWAHLDIAPMMAASDPLKKITTAGSIGFGVRIFATFLMNLGGKH